MNTMAIIALIQAAAQIAKAVGPVVESLRDTINSQDEIKVKAALRELQEANNIIYARVQDKLRTPRPG
jgi:hypothetical protein